MKHCAIAALCLALLTAAQAEEALPEVAQPEVAQPEVTQPGAAPKDEAPVLLALPEHQGYAVRLPEMLLRQRLFGLAHGASMLAAACLDVPTHAAAVENAYAAWYAKQAAAIKALMTDLSRYHYGPRAEEAQWSDIARTLNLKESISPALKGVSLDEACRTLPETLTRQRFALDELLAMPADAPLEPKGEPRIETQIEAAPPAAKTEEKAAP